MNFNLIFTIRAVELILACQAIISTLEILKIRQILDDSGLLSWRIQRLNNSTINSILKRVQIDVIFRYPNVIFLLILKLFSSIILIYFILTAKSTALPLIIITLVTLLMNLRSSQSNDGSDQMASILFLTCTIAECVPAVYGKELAIMFITAQAALSYGTSGFLKLTKGGWQDGTYVTEILKTSSFGNIYLIKYVQKNKWLARVLGRSVAFGDSILAFSCLMPPKICLVLLFFGISLHIGIAMVMGLNTFLWSFGACYPATYFISANIYHNI